MDLQVRLLVLAACLAACRAANPHYRFSYAVSDASTGDVKTHSETRVGGAVQGFYTLLEPGGTRRVVHYTADDVHGFKAVVQREGSPAAQGHVRAGPEAALLVSSPAASVDIAAGQRPSLKTAEVAASTGLSLATPLVTQGSAYVVPGSHPPPQQHASYAIPLHYATAPATTSLADPTSIRDPDTVATKFGAIADHQPYKITYADIAIDASYASPRPLAYAQAAPTLKSYASEVPLAYALSAPTLKSYASEVPLAYAQAAPTRQSYASEVPLAYAQAAPTLKSYASEVPLAYAQAAPTLKSYASEVPLAYAQAAPTLKSYASEVPLAYAQAPPTLQSYASAVPLAYAQAVPTLKSYASAVPLAYAQAAPTLKSYASAVPLAYAQAPPTLQSYASAVPLAYAQAVPTLKSYASAVPLAYPQAAAKYSSAAAVSVAPTSYSFISRSSLPLAPFAAPLAIQSLGLNRLETVDPTAHEGNLIHILPSATHR